MNEINKQMTTLKLLGMHESLEYRLAEAERNGQPYEDFLRSLFEDEILHRSNKKADRLRKRAKFRDRFQLEDFEAEAGRGLRKDLLNSFRKLRFLGNCQNIIFTGATGTGKTFLAQAIGNAACREGEETYFTSVNLFFEEIKALKVQGRYLNFMTKLKRIRLLILDDFGLRNFSHEEATTLYDILEERYNKGSLIVTSQIKPEGWRNLFEDEVIAEAILDRIISCGREVTLKGGSYRKKHKKDQGVEN